MPKRINVIGTSGSGKSTFARKLAGNLQVPHIELDSLYWKPNWTEPSDEEFFSKLQEALSAPSWVLDGNYSRTNAIKWARVDLVIWLDYSFGRTMFQAITRAIRRARTQEELWPGTGNRESFRASFFSRKSILLWTLRQHGPTRKRNLRLMAEATIPGSPYSHIKFLRLKNHQEAEMYLRSGLA